jgi:hypothetical protein
MNPEPTFPHKYLFKEVAPRTLARKRRAGQCKHWGCNNPSRYSGRDCETCKARKARAKNMTYYAFTQVKSSAGKRDIPFELTYDEFKEFDLQTNYVESKGRESESLTIDRIDSSLGYTIDNIRTLTWSQNCAKLVEGMTDPIDPIAKALASAAGDDNWHKFKKMAVKVLNQVEILQGQEEGGFAVPEDPF